MSRSIDHPTRAGIDLLDGDFYAAEPFEHYRFMRDEAPVYFDEKNELWAVSRYADVMRVSKDSATFCSGKSSRPEPGSWLPSMINMDDPDHKRRRNLVNRGFTKGRVEAHEEKVRGICNALVDAVADEGRCDFVRDIAAPLPMIVIGDMLGVEPEDRDQLLRWSEDMLLSTSSTAGEAERERSAAAGMGWAGYAANVIADRRTRPPLQDLISVLVNAEIDGERLDDLALVHETLLILVGGDETTRHVISGGMYALLTHPDQLALLRREPERIPLAVEEMLRWVTPIKNMNRTATRDVELHGQTIARDDRVLLLYHSANRDPRGFDAPDEFDITRNPNDHLAFGGYGAHFCLGASLARLELRIMFEVLLQRLPALALDTHAQGGDSPPLRRSNFIVGIESMPVLFEAR
jgi:cytochrome P450 family 142 subfamily A polypeptide 1